jgi:predicted TIM-barrel fold metal-dependent hydrolase
MQPRIFGPYESIRRDYSIGEFIADAAPCGVSQSVYVQANWAPAAYIDEVRWVDEVHGASGWPQAVVAYADLTAADFESRLERLSEFPIVRGIRMQLHWHEHAQYRFAARPDIAADRHFQTAVRRLGRFGWAFDLQLFPAQLRSGLALARACPDVYLVLQHAGMPVDFSPGGWRFWRQEMTALAAAENVAVKLSGLGTFIRLNDPAFIHRVVTEVIDCFGPGRCLFGSNFPIEKLWTDYASLLAAYRAALAAYSADERVQIFSGNAGRIYRL